MKPIYSLLLSFIYILACSQNKLNVVNVNDFTVNGNALIFAENKLICLQNKFGKFNELKNLDRDFVPFIKKTPDKIIENNCMTIYVKNNNAYIKYINLEKSRLILNYKKEVKFSSSTTREDFKKYFKKSYDSPSYIPGTPPKRAVGYTIEIHDKTQKAYLNFTFYYNDLTSISISNTYSNITD